MSRKERGTENERVGEGAPDERARVKGKRIFLKKKEEEDRLCPLVLLSYWSNACPALAATDDITV